jgi:hypothetical protein
MIAALLLSALAWAEETVTYDRLFGPEAAPVAASAPVASASAAAAAPGDALADLGEAEAPSIPNWIWPAAIGAVGLLAASRLRQPARLTAAPAVQVVTRQTIGDKAALVVVEVTDADGDRRRLLVGTGAGAPSLVADLGHATADVAPVPVAAAPARPARFADSLDALLPSAPAPAALAGFAAPGAAPQSPRTMRFAAEDVLDTPPEHPTGRGSFVARRPPARAVAGSARAIAAFTANAAPARVPLAAAAPRLDRASEGSAALAESPVAARRAARARHQPLLGRLAEVPPPVAPRPAAELVRASAVADEVVRRGQSLVDEVLAERESEEENPFLAEATRLGLAC